MISKVFVDCTQGLADNLNRLERVVEEVERWYPRNRWENMSDRELEERKQSQKKIT